MTNRITTFISAAAFNLAIGSGAAFAQEAYSDWDTDGTAGINQEEFNTGFGEGGVYDSWDANSDGSLTEDEFNAGVYDGYDADDSGALEEPEFGDVGDDMGDGGFFDV
ncbi:hypothetical protein U0C82_16835 [Fulvimarina sp. 2208YS6-2-32]|uniref:EF-hand domain-containing protein n=1 Tax=Fulvimarina uroteuthidis TaxID=3098149 RepID=A0ABU5I798_9HYPH|nr:hypothetical protein [Fulvimarina sp. 2208YS6-2-32]MDY8110808.1 hypothetical protein [Fulvimarina sp. 2208YS6-2-32]